MNNDRLKILVVDDEELYTSILEYVLSPSYDIITAESGEKALEIAANSKPDLILLDAVMPDISGFEVLKKLKDNIVTQNIPVIFITALNNDEDEEMGFFLGAIDYITKPFVNSVMLARIRTHVQIIKHIRTIEQTGLVDALTNLPNRRGFDERFALEWERATREKVPISLLFMDMDRFKHYNDTYGHPFGDFLIQFSGEVYKKTLKRATDFVSRWGGDEFVILLPNTNSEGACEVAEDIRNNIATSVIPCGDGTVSATVSIGVCSLTPTLDSDPNDFMGKTDKALYAAKKGGRNRYHLYNECNAHLYADEKRPDTSAEKPAEIKKAPPAEKKPSEFIKKLRAVPLLDIDGALSSIGGSEELYEKVLMLVITHIPHYIELTEKSLFESKGGLRDFTINIHSVKSSLKQIGYTKLASLTEALENAARKGDGRYCRDYYKIFKDNLLAFYNQICAITNIKGEPYNIETNDFSAEQQEHDAYSTEKKILVVDDSTTNLAMMKVMLNSFYKVYPVSSGEAALKFLDKQHPNLILLDVEMPGMGGKELMSIIKSKPHLSDIPIIFLTGLADLESEAEAFTLGAADYIRKPVNDVIMLHRVKAQLELDALKRELEGFRRL